jgi:hypothetical protein
MSDVVLIVLLAAWVVGVVVVGRSSPDQPAATSPGLRSFVSTIAAVAGGTFAGDLAAGGVEDASDTLILGASVGVALWLVNRGLAAHRERQRRRYATPSR